MAVDPVVPRSRRNVLLASVGGLAGLLVSRLAQPEATDATTGTMVYGTVMDEGVDQTILTSAGLNTAIFQNTSGSGNALEGDAAGAGTVGVTGINTSTGFGVWGECHTGTGVKGLSVTGDGVFGTSTSGEGVIGISASGIGATGQSTSSIGVIGQSTSSVGAIGVTAATDEPGLYGLSMANNCGVIGLSQGAGYVLPSTSPAKTGVYGYAAQDATAVGVTGASTLGTGIVGQSVSNVGVVGFVGSSTPPAAPLGTAVFGASAIAGHDLYAGGSGRIGLLPNLSAGPPASGLYATGDVFCDAAGNLWACVAGGTPGSFRKLAGPASAGALHAINPARAYDSRLSDGPLAVGAMRTVAVATATTGGTLVPSGATAIAYNLTVTRTVGAGWLAIVPHAAPFGGTSSINWFGAGQTLANGGIVKLGGNRQCDIWSGGGAGASTQLVIDVTGYYE